MSGVRGRWRPICPVKQVIQSAPKLPSPPQSYPSPLRSYPVRPKVTQLVEVRARKWVGRPVNQRRDRGILIKMSSLYDCRWMSEMTPSPQRLRKIGQKSVMFRQCCTNWASSITKVKQTPYKREELCIITLVHNIIKIVVWQHQWEVEERTFISLRQYLPASYRSLMFMRLPTWRLAGRVQESLAGWNVADWTHLVPLSQTRIDASGNPQS